MKHRALALSLLAAVGTFAQTAAMESVSLPSTSMAAPKTSAMLASTNLQRKQDFPSYPVVDSLFHLSTGDQLRLRWWGIGSGDLDLVVDTRGDVVVPDIGRVPATRTTFNHVRDSIEALLRHRTKVTLIDLQIVKIAQAQIRVSGLTPNPGIFDLPPGTRLSSVATQSGLDVFSLLFKMQGGDPIWALQQEHIPSLRRVLVVRGDKDSTWYDLVSAMRAGDASQDPPLYSGDRVQFVSRGTVVQITGGANFPGGMEIVPGETVGRFLFAAGEDSTRAIKLDNAFGAVDQKRMDSSIVMVRCQPKPYMPRPSIAWVLGKVRNPGALPLKVGNTAKDLVDQAGGVVGGDDSGVVVAVKRGWAWLGAGRQRGLAEATQYPEVKVAMLAYFEEMHGTYTDINTPLQAGDTVFVYPAEQVVWVGGKVGKPGFVPWKKGDRIEDYIALAGGYADRAWQNRVRVFDLQSGLSLEPTAQIRPGAAVIVPEERYIPVEQWVSLLSSVATMCATLTYLILAVK